MKTAVEKIITEIDNELQTLEGLDGKEITGSKIALEFVKKVAIEALEMEKEREKSIFSIAYRMTPIGFGKEYCDAEFEKFNKTFKQK
jgi:hypothetical protein